MDRDGEVEHHANRQQWRIASDHLSCLHCS
jgi:hypothetical protein